MQNLKQKAVQIPRNFPAKVKKAIRKAPCRKVYPPFPGHLRRQETLSFDTPEIISFSRRDVKRSGKHVFAAPCSPLRFPVSPRVPFDALCANLCLMEGISCQTTK